MRPVKVRAECGCVRHGMKLTPCRQANDLLATDDERHRFETHVMRAFGYYWPDSLVGHEVPGPAPQIGEVDEP